MDDQLIILGCKKGEEKAFRQLVDKFAGQIMSICIRYLKDTALAKDATQETLIAVFKSIQQYSGSGMLGGWISKIAVNVCLREIRTRKVFTDIDSIELGCTDHHQNHDLLEAEDILKLVNEMPETLRLVFNMSLIEGYSHLEIATLLGISESSSRVYLLRSRSFMKEKLTHNSGKGVKVLHFK